LVAFAESIGAKRKDGRINWRVVAEALAKKFDPDLLAAVDDRKQGRPAKADWRWLVDDVHRIMQDQNCSARQACEALTKGARPWRVSGFTGDGRRIPLRLAGNKLWKGMKAPTLYQRYHEALSDWRTFQRRALDKSRKISKIDAWRQRGKAALPI